MKNKQLRTEKKIGIILLKTNTEKFYDEKSLMKFFWMNSFFGRFSDQIRPQKPVLITKIECNVFLTLFDNMCILSCNITTND